jgi:hypothetical protein
MTDEDKFRRSQLLPTPVEIRTIFREELVIAERIEEMRGLPVGEWESKVTRNLGTMTCPMCSFASLCKSDMLGEDTRLQKKIDFVPSTYGYDK